ncbi:hypothetical protein D3C76_1747920 [compost metagenome]
MLDAVIKRLQPDLYRLRQIYNLYMMPRINSFMYVQMETFTAVQRERMPLSRLAKVGGMHSWANT